MASNNEVRIQVDNPCMTVPSSITPDLFSGCPQNYLEVGVPLYRAALEGDWETARGLIVNNNLLSRATIGKRRDTALHIAAAAAKCSHFVKELVKLMREDDLVLRNGSDNTALCYAAASGNEEIAKVMVEKNKRLPLIKRSDGVTPLYMATLLGHRDMAWYLLSVTDFDEFTPIDRFELLITSINSELYDVALEILDEFPELAVYDQDAEGKSALGFLARKCLKSSNSIQQGWLTKCRNYLAGPNNNMVQNEALQLVDKLWGAMRKMNYEDISDSFGSPSRFLFDAAQVGNVEFIAILIGSYPDLIWKVNNQGISMFHIAVANRQAEVFNLIYEIGAIKDLIATYTDKKGNNMLHLAANSPPFGSLDSISGAALQMQRELLWYKEVENVVQPQFRDAKNKAQKTPKCLFAVNHEKLRKEGEDWMKTTANSCSVVAALITTVAFTAAFTVPGGNDQNKGTPIFQRSPIFVAFTIADAISLFTSSTAIVMFLGILTSRYAQQDFLTSLPLKLLVGLSTLFLSITFMMVAFVLTFFIIFKAGISWLSVPIFVAILAAVPVVLFAFGQFPLLIDIYRSTYQARYLFRPNNHRIFRGKKKDTLLKRLTLKYCKGKHH